MVDMFDDSRSSKYCYLNEKQESAMKFPLLVINVITVAAIFVVSIIAAYERELAVTSNIVIALIGLSLVAVAGFYFYFGMRGSKCSPEDIKRLRTDIK